MSSSTQFVDRQRVAGGRFSTVYRARDSVDGQHVALKVTTPEDDRPPHSSRDEVKMLQELQKLPGAGRSHIVKLLSCFWEDLDDLVLVFPYYPSTLNTYLRNHAKRNVPKLNLYANFGSSNSSDSDSAPELVNNLTLDKATQIVKGIADGLAFLHSNGIIHRDIKPENIMFQNFDPNPIIIDFGICYKYPNNYGKEQPSKKICDVSTGIYRSPELVFGITDYSYGVDIWSFGILISLLFSKHVKPVFSNDDYGDFRLVSLIFKTFGTPTLDTWPEARKSPTFSRLEPTKVDPISVDTILPRADGTIKEIFQRMMVYESSRRLSASEISQKLTESEK